MRTLRIDGWNKVRNGQTTIEEVLRVTQIEEHLDALPHTRPDGRLSLPRQISMATAAKLRTADAARLDDKLVVATERALMHLSEAISSTYLGRNEPAETREDLPA